MFGFGFLGLIAYFTLGQADTDLKKNLANYIADSIHSCILLLMTLTSIKVYAIIADLDVNPNPVNFLDDLLLFICIPAHFLLAICIITPSLYYIVYLGTMEQSIGQVIVYILSVSYFG